MGSKRRTIAEILSDARRMQAEAQDREVVRVEKEHEKVRVEKRRSRKKDNRRTAAIPWALLDELEGEKAKFEDEKGYNEVFRRF